MIELHDERATVAAGRALGNVIHGGDAVALIGDLGAGKTTLVGGIVEAIGGGVAASPTFSLVNEYPGGRLVVWHVDLYRLDRERELVELGLEEMFGDPRGVVVVEWADKFAIMPGDHLRIELTHRAGTRCLGATGTGRRGSALAAELLASLR